MQVNQAYVVSGSSLFHSHKTGPNFMPWYQEPLTPLTVFTLRVKYETVI